MGVIGTAEEQDSQRGDQITNQDEAIIAGLPNMKIATKVNIPNATTMKAMAKRRMTKVSGVGVIGDTTSGRTKSNEPS